MKLKDFWKKRSFTKEDIKSTRALLDILLPMEEEKIKSNEHGFATIHIYALENNLDLELFLASGLNVNELSRRDKTWIPATRITRKMSLSSFYPEKPQEYSLIGAISSLCIALYT